MGRNVGGQIIERRVITVEEVADFLRVGVGTVRNEIRCGTLPIVNPGGGKFRIDCGTLHHVYQTTSPLLTVREVAKALDLCDETVKRYVRRGILVATCVYTNRSIRFAQEDVDAFCRGRSR